MENRIRHIHRDPDVFEVVVPFEAPGIAGTNCYIVKDGEESLVVDAGAPGDRAEAVMRRAFAEAQVDPSRASFFLTHFHTDHSGLLDRIAPPEAPVYVNARDVEHMLRLRGEDYRSELFGRLAQEGVPEEELGLYREHTVSFESFDVARHRLVRVADGDELSCGRWRFRVVETPGHTVGHQSLLQPDSGILFGGDSVLFVISPSVDFSPYGPDGLQKYLDTLDKLISLPATVLFHSHGDLLDGWRERAEWIKRHRVKRLEDAFRSIASRQGCTGYEAVRGISWNVPFDSWEEISLTQRWCIVGEGLGYLDHLVFLGQAEREAGHDGLLRYRTVGSGVFDPEDVHFSEGRTHCEL